MGTVHTQAVRAHQRYSLLRTPVSATQYKLPLEDTIPDCGFTHPAGEAVLGKTIDSSFTGLLHKSGEINGFAHPLLRGLSATKMKVLVKADLTA
jgi:hypothetical protein